MAFVIAADEENVASAIGRRLATTGQPITSRLYLEKIVQVPVRIPALSRDQTEEYLALLMLADLGEHRRGRRQGERVSSRETRPARAAARGGFARGPARRGRAGRWTDSPAAPLPRGAPPARQARAG